jgi:ABC-type sugar transport system ATPase subunit
VTNGSPDDIIMQVKNLTIPRKFEDVSFELRRGEVLAFAGLVGSGKSDLARTIFGVNKKYSGQIILEGKEIHPVTPHEASSLGIGYVPISRKDEGILSNFDAQSNISSAMLDQLGFFIDKKKETQIAEQMIKDFNVHPGDKKQNITSFSGGNQQKIVVSRWIAAGKKVVLLDEPTRGVDVGAKQEIYDNLKRLAAEGIGIIIFSSETEELLSSSDRIMIMHEGKITKELITAKTTGEEVLQYSISADGKQ